MQSHLAGTQRSFLYRAGPGERSRWAGEAGAHEALAIYILPQHADGTPGKFRCTQNAKRLPWRLWSSSQRHKKSLASPGKPAPSGWRRSSLEFMKSCTRAMRRLNCWNVSPTRRPQRPQRHQRPHRPPKTRKALHDRPRKATTKAPQHHRDLQRHQRQQRPQRPHQTHPKWYPVVFGGGARCM